ncbi:hypothetical protein Lser_V15G19665 [Lactuca serriola]
MDKVRRLDMVGFDDPNVQQIPQLLAFTIHITSRQQKRKIIIKTKRNKNRKNPPPLAQLLSASPESTPPAFRRRIPSSVGSAASHLASPVTNRIARYLVT